MIKNLYFFLVIFYSSISIAQNTIIGIYDDNVITLRQLEAITEKKDSKDKKISIIHALISEKIEIDYIKKLKITPSSSSINSELVKIAEQNNISLEQFKQIANYDEIYSIVLLNLSKIGLKQIMVNGNRDKPIDIRSKEGVSIYQNWLRSIKDKMYIEIFEEKF